MKSITIKIWPETVKKLRMIYALTGKPMVAILDDIVSERLEGCQKIIKAMDDAIRNGTGKPPRKPKVRRKPPSL